MGVLLNIFGDRLDEVGGPDVVDDINYDTDDDDSGDEIADSHSGLFGLCAVPWWRPIFDNRLVFPNG